MKSSFEGNPRGWTIRVDLTPEQEVVAWRNIGAQRFAYNWAVAQFEDEYGRGPEGDRRIWSPIGLRTRWYEQRAEVAPWWAENSKEAYSSGIAAAVQALQNFQDGRRGRRKDRPGFPRKKRKVVAAAVFSATTGIGLRSGRDLKLPHVGVVRSRESLRRLFRAQTRGDLRVTGLTLRHRAGAWFVTLKYRVASAAQYTVSAGADPDSVVGIDLGVGQLLAQRSDGVRVERGDGLRAAERRVRAAGQRTKRRTRGSVRWRAAKDDARRAAYRVACIRKDLIHKATTDIAKTHGTVVLEDLAVKSMSRGWSRTAGASGMAEFRRQIEYKAAHTLIADRWYPSSKTCSACDVVNPAITLKDDEWDCPQPGCGAHHQRDVNAAANLAQLGAAWIGGKSVPCAPHTELKRKPRLKKAA